MFYRLKHKIMGKNTNTSKTIEHVAGEQSVIPNQQCPCATLPGQGLPDSGGATCEPGPASRRRYELSQVTSSP